MKRIIISSMAVLGIIGGGLFIMDNQITKTINPIKQSDNVIERGVTYITPEVATQEPVVVDNIETPAVVVIKSRKDILIEEQKERGMESLTFYQYMLFKYLITTQVYTFTNNYLKTTYPEKFTDDNLESTLQYIYDNYGNYKPTITNSIYTDFHW